MLVHGHQSLFNTYLPSPCADHRWPFRQSHQRALWCLAHTGWWCTWDAPQFPTGAVIRGKGKGMRQEFWVHDGWRGIMSRQCWVCVCASVHLFLVVPDGAPSVVLQSGVVAASASVRANVVPHLHMQKDFFFFFFFTCIRFQRYAQLNITVFQPSTLPSPSP